MQTIRGWSPLLNAAENGHEGIVSTLLDHHARVDVFDTEGKAALHLAAEHGYKLVSCGKCCEGDIIGFESVFTCIPPYSSHACCLPFLFQVCNALLTHKAFINARTMSGLTALHLAAMKGYNDLVWSLITQHHSQKDGLTLVRRHTHFLIGHWGFISD